MRIITFNVNGIRAAAKKGLFDWLKNEHADFICLQETKAHLQHTLPESLHLAGYSSYFADAEKAGYSGVGIYCRQQPEHVQIGMGWENADREGRYLRLDYPTLSIISLYMPSGTSGAHRQAIKYEFMDHFYHELSKMRQQKRHYIICGDWNIAHKNIDLKNWRSNQKNSGFLPEERAWLDKVFGQLGWIDAFRVLNHSPDQYTFWSSRGAAWEKNVGWRIDYQVISPQLESLIKHVSIYKEKRFSDHAPLIIDYDIHLAVK